MEAVFPKVELLSRPAIQDAGTDQSLLDSRQIDHRRKSSPKPGFDEMHGRIPRGDLAENADRPDGLLFQLPISPLPALQSPSSTPWRCLDNYRRYAACGVELDKQRRYYLYSKDPFCRGYRQRSARVEPVRIDGGCLKFLKSSDVSAKSIRVHLDESEAVGEE